MLYQMHNTSATWQQAAHTTYHILAAQQEPYRKVWVLIKKYLSRLEKKLGEWTISSSSSSKVLAIILVLYIICHILKPLFVLELSLYYFFIGTVVGHCKTEC